MRVTTRRQLEEQMAVVASDSGTKDDAMWHVPQLPTRVVGATSQLDLKSLTPLSVPGCG